MKFALRATLQANDGRSRFFLRNQSESGGRLGAVEVGADGGAGRADDWSTGAGLTLTRTVAEIWATILGRWCASRGLAMRLTRGSRPGEGEEGEE